MKAPCPIVSLQEFVAVPAIQPYAGLAPTLCYKNGFVQNPSAQILARDPTLDHQPAEVEGIVRQVGPAWGCDLSQQATASQSSVPLRQDEGAAVEFGQQVGAGGSVSTGLPLVDASGSKPGRCLLQQIDIGVQKR